jgi:peptidoglycan/xylan/chitin deacetylase (PgdA/CDA1 family)
VRTQLRRILKHAWFQILFCSGMTRWAKWRLQSRREAIVLTFHRVLRGDLAEESNSPPGMIVHEETFDALLDYLWKIVSFGSIPDADFSPGPLKVFFTFDDGWCDNYDVVISKLKTRAIPACIFVCPQLLGLDQPFWPEHAMALFRAASESQEGRSTFRDIVHAHGIMLRELTLAEFMNALKEHSTVNISSLISSLAQHLSAPLCKNDRTMDWSQINDLARQGCTIGNHTAHHEILTALSPAQQVSEIAAAHHCLSASLGESVPLFSYPNGSWSASARDSVARSGMRLAFLNSPGIWSESTDPLLIPRINLSESRLVGLNGTFSAAAAHYHLFWVPYVSRRTGHLTDLGPRTGDSTQAAA